jgi:phosphonate transport system ATP-binding protein
MLEVSGLIKQFQSRERVLSGVSFTIKQGEFVALLGLSGSGKSTLFRCLTLLEDWDEGSFIYNNENILPLSKRKRKLYRRDWAYIKQKVSLIKRRTALENVLAGRLNQTTFWRVVFNRFSKEDVEKSLAALERVGLKHKAYERADQLSGGEQQRVAIARALVQGAKVVFADEPVSSLDPESAKQVLLHLQSVSKSENITVLCSLHQVDLAEKYASRILGLAKGEIVVDISDGSLKDEEKKKIYSYQELTNA